MDAFSVVWEALQKQLGEVLSAHHNGTPEQRAVAISKSIDLLSTLNETENKS